MPWRRVPFVVGTFVLLAGCHRRPGDGAAPSGGAPPPVSLPVPAPSVPAATPPDLTLLFTADLRGQITPNPATEAQGGLARRASLVDRIRLEAKDLPVILVDAGDILASAADPPPAATIYAADRRTPIVLTSYARMGVDAVTLGERDLALGAKPLKAALKAAKLAVVAANLFAEGDERPFPADQLIEAGGISVGVFGILDVTTEEAAALKRSGFHTGDAAQAARAAAEGLRARGARLVVGLFHVTRGPARVREILAGANGIDVVVLGHRVDVTGRGTAGAAGSATSGDDALPPGTVMSAGTTRVVRPVGTGAALGRLDVRALRAGGGSPRFNVNSLPVTNALPEHSGVALIERVEIEQVHRAEDAAAAALRRKKHQPEPPSPTETWTFSSNGACELCHKEQSEQWKTTDHAQALATLQKSKHDREPACLGCHMTAFLQPGGTRSMYTLTTYFSNVGCESCHGPSADHVRSLDKKKGTSRTVGAEVCLGCHTGDQNIGPFDYAAALKSILGPGHGAPAVPAHPG